MGDVAQQGRTVLFVSHNLGAVRSLCTRALVLSGRARCSSTARVDEAIARLPVERGGPRRAGRPGQLRGGAAWRSTSSRCCRSASNQAGEVRALFDATEPITIDIEYEVTARLRGARTVIALVTSEGEVAFQSTDHQTRDADLPPGRYRTSCTIPARS